MTKKELYLKTLFCCIACDGEIAEEEISMVRELCTQDQLFANILSFRLICSDNTHSKANYL